MWGLTLCISNKLPGDADAAGPGTPLRMKAQTSGIRMNCFECPACVFFVLRLYVVLAIFPDTGRLLVCENIGSCWPK